MVCLTTLGFDLLLHELDPFIGVHLVPLLEAKTGSAALTNLVVAAHYLSEVDATAMAVPETGAEDA